MTEYNYTNNPSNETNITIESHHNLKEKLKIAELILKTLAIKYHIKNPKTCISGLKNTLFRKSLNQVQEELIKL